MKLASLLLVSLCLSSCAAKPWMVGSVNDQFKPRCVLKYGNKSSLGGTSGAGSNGGGFINPVKSSPQNPVH